MNDRLNPNNTDFESKIRRSLSNHEVPYNPDDWGFMEAALDKHERPKWFAICKGVLVAAFFVGTSAYLATLLFMPSRQSSFSEQLAPLPSTTTTHAAQLLDRAPNTPSTSDVQSKTNASVTTNINQVTESSTTKPSVPTFDKKHTPNNWASKKASPVENTSQEPLLTSWNGPLGKRMGKEQTVHSQSSQTDVHYPNLLSNNSSNNTKGATPQTAVFAQMNIVDDEKSVASASDKMPTAPTSLSNEHLVDNASQTLALLPEHRVNLQPNVSALYSPETGLRNVLLQKITRNLDKKHYIAKKSIKKPIIPKFPPFAIGAFTSLDGNFIGSRPRQTGFTGGLSFEHRFRPTWSLQTGLAYTQKHFQARELGSADDSPDYRLDYAKVNALEIPLIVRFHFVGKHFKNYMPYVGMGNSIYVPLEQEHQYVQRGTTEPATLPATTETRVTSRANTDRIIWGVFNMRAGINFKLSPEASFNVETHFKTSMSRHEIGIVTAPYYENTNLYRIYSYGAQMGLTINF